MLKPERPIILLHVPKAGGTTVRHHLNAWFPDAKHIQFTAPEAWDQMSDDEIAEHDVFTGHIGFRFVPRVPNAILVTFLRDPFERALSQFYYHKHNLRTCREDVVTFDTYLHSTLSGFREVLENGIVWQFAWDQYLRYRDTKRFPDDETLYHAAIENIRSVHFVGFQETMDSDLCQLARLLGVDSRVAILPRANKTIDKPQNPAISEEERAYIESISNLDIRFVAEVRRMYRQ